MTDIQEELRPDSVCHHLRQMMATEGWRLLVRMWNKERERLISEGKKSRLVEDKAQMWAALEGFDSAALAAEKMLRCADVIKNALPGDGDGDSDES